MIADSRAADGTLLEAADSRPAGGGVAATTIPWNLKVRSPQSRSLAAVRK